MGAFIAIAFFAPRTAGSDIPSGEILATSTVATTTNAEEKKPDPPKIVAAPVVLAETAAPAGSREAWVEKLIQCESTGNPQAVNPKDRDGTASYGILQFKPSTFAAYSAKYGIEGELMDAEAQIKIVHAMMDDKSVRWHNEFPDCVRKHGLPPAAVLY